MGLTGKYNFSGIKSKGAKGLEMLLSVAWSPFAGILKIPVVGTIVDGTLELLVNWLANNGLVILNIGAIIVDGEFDQDGFDKNMDAAIKAAGLHPDTLTDAQKKKIDDGVRNALRKFGPLNPT